MENKNLKYFVSEQNYNLPKKKPVLPIYELRYKINRFHHEVLLSTFQASLAYGMRKKLLRERPKEYHITKLIVKIL